MAIRRGLGGSGRLLGSVLCFQSNENFLAERHEIRYEALQDYVAPCLFNLHDPEQQV